MLKIEDATPGTRIKVIKSIGAFYKEGDQATINQVHHNDRIGEILVVQFDDDDCETDIYLDIWHEHFEVCS